MYICIHLYTTYAFLKIPLAFFMHQGVVFAYRCYECLLMSTVSSYMNGRNWPYCASEYVLTLEQ